MADSKLDRSLDLGSLVAAVHALAGCVRRILWSHLPIGARVIVFGSRATGRGVRALSDLALLIDSPVELPLIVLPDVREALAASHLPFSVDLLERRDAGTKSLTQLEPGGMTELRPLSAEHG